MNLDLNQRIDNIIHGNKNLNQNVKVLTELIVSLNQSLTIMPIRVDLLQKGLDDVEKNKKSY